MKRCKKCRSKFITLNITVDLAKEDIKDDYIEKGYIDSYSCSCGEEGLELEDIIEELNIGDTVIFDRELVLSRESKALEHYLLLDGEYEIEFITNGRLIFKKIDGAWLNRFFYKK